MSDRASLAMPPGQVFQEKRHGNYKVLFCGMTGSGKTTLALQMLQREKHDWKIVFDPEQQWASRLGGFSAGRFDYFRAALAESGGVCFDSTPIFGGDKHAAAEWLLRFVWEFSGQWRGEKLVVLDDFPDYLPKNESRFRAHVVNEVVGAGRRRGVDLYFLCRQVTEMATNLRGTFSHVFAFKQPDAVCAKNMASFGFDLREVQRLEPMEFLRLDVATGKIRRGKVRHE